MLRSSRSNASMPCRPRNNRWLMQREPPKTDRHVDCVEVASAPTRPPSWSSRRAPCALLPRLGPAALRGGTHATSSCSCSAFARSRVAARSYAAPPLKPRAVRDAAGDANPVEMRALFLLPKLVERRPADVSACKIHLGCSTVRRPACPPLSAAGRGCVQATCVRLHAMVVYAWLQAYMRPQRLRPVQTAVNGPGRELSCCDGSLAR